VPFGPAPFYLKIILPKRNKKGGGKNSLAKLQGKGGVERAPAGLSSGVVSLRFGGLNPQGNRERQKKKKNQTQTTGIIGGKKYRAGKNYGYFTGPKRPLAKARMTKSVRQWARDVLGKKQNLFQEKNRK